MEELKSPFESDKCVTDPFEWRLFYELMQQYRWAGETSQVGVMRAFEAVKEFGRGAVALASPRIAVQEEGDASLREVLESHLNHMRMLLESLEYKTTGRDPKNTGFAYAAIPEWSIRQRIQAMEQALSSAPAAAMKGDQP